MNRYHKAIKKAYMLSAMNGEVTMIDNITGVADEVAQPVPAATLEFLNTGNHPSTACAVLTPAIKANLLELETGQTLLVRTDDPTARLDVPAWCKLTGNVLQTVAEEDDGVVDFFIKKESKR
jgi:TusA-related sulfurtransferase